MSRPHAICPCMRSILATVAAILFLALAGHGLSRAAVTGAPGATPGMELLVFEHPDCAYCPAFRGRIAPRYKQSAHATEAPLRYVDIAATETREFGLKSPITQVPTAVVMKQGREVDRIAGLWSPDHFFKMVTIIIRRAD